MAQYALALAALAGVDASGTRLVREHFTGANATSDSEGYRPVTAEYIVHKGGPSGREFT